MAEEKTGSSPDQEKQKAPEIVVHDDPDPNPRTSQESLSSSSSGEEDGKSAARPRSTSHVGSAGEGGCLAPITTVNTRASQVSEHLSSLGPDTPAQPWSSFVEIPDEFYDRVPPRRKLAIVALLSYCSFLAPISSTTVLTAISNIADEYDTTGTIIGVSNALYMLFMGISPLVWGPMSEVCGRRWIILSTLFLFCGCSLGTALAPNLVAFFLFRILTAFEGTAFILVGSASLSDIYRPTERATAMGWFLSGTLFGPAFGPFIGGIIVTYRSWRVIFYLQTALAGLALAAAAVLLPETIHRRKWDTLTGHNAVAKARVLWSMINPMRVIRLYVYPNVITAGMASSSLVWNQYSLLTPITYVLNPRFGLTTPMQAGLFYLAPGCGYVTGTFFGGRYADRIVRQWIVRRGGVRVPEDRLRSALPFMGIVIPACMLVYGWAVEKAVGGIPLVVIPMFIQGVAQLFCFPSLNTYCLDVMQERGSEVIAGNYFVRYLFAALGTAVVLPAVETIGVGWFSTISAFFLVASAAAMTATVIWGRQWRERVDAWRYKRRKAEYERAQAELNARAVV